MTSLGPGRRLIWLRFKKSPRLCSHSSRHEAVKAKGLYRGIYQSQNTETDIEAVPGKASMLLSALSSGVAGEDRQGGFYHRGASPAHRREKVFFVLGSVAHETTSVRGGGRQPGQQYARGRTYRACWSKKETGLHQRYLKLHQWSDSVVLTRGVHVALVCT